MFDKKHAAEFFVVAWCKNWTLRQYLNVALERESVSAYVEQSDVELSCAEFPWIPADLGSYIAGRLVRSHVEDNFPKLSAWLHSREDDVKRLACASQIEKLRDKGVLKAASHPPRDKDAKYRRAMYGAGLISAAKQSQSRSAWSTCKA